MIRIVWCLVLIRLNAGARLLNCADSDVTFEKVLGLRPPNGTEPLLLYKLEENVTQRPVTSECIAKCQSNDECTSFVLFYSVSQCYWFKNNPNGTDESENIIDENVGWFIKTCFSTGNKCDKLWAFERIPGATLVGNDTKILPGSLSRSDCQQYCLNETEFSCRSAKFKITDTNQGKNAYIRGRCVLSNTNRHELLSSFRVSGYDDEYFENECAPRRNHKNEFCAYEEYENVTLAHSDIFFEKKTKDDCQNLCNEFKTFNCRGFSIVNGDNCYLDSEDSKIYGPNLLKKNVESVYYEKASCLNITVTCTNTYMTVRYDPEIDFFGRMYLQGYSESPQCFVTGQGRLKSLELKVPLMVGKCGIIKVEGPLNRTLLADTLIIQYNSIIQTQNDRIIKVGCIFGNETKILIGTGVQISPGYPNKGSSLINPGTNRTFSPEVIMKILDFHTHREISDTQVGQELQLIIEFKKEDSGLDIWASHLVAMTEKNEESIFLLDDRGCPTNLNIFPTLQKVYTGNTTELVANFQAFKFASSPVVRFSVLIQFCANKCPPIQCGTGVSYGRRKREMVFRAIDTVNGTTVVKINRSEFEERMNVVNEWPLEYIMLVRDSKSTSDRLVFGENNKIVVAGFDYTTNEVCLDYSLVIGLIILWILIQVFFVAGCIILVKRYKRYYQHECTKQSLEELHKNFGIGFSNLENRRVHWADNENIL